MSWFKKISSDLRRSWGNGSPVTCPKCQNWIWAGQLFDKCPKCNRPTNDLNPNFYAKCPDCGSPVMTGKVADCDKCGYDWTEKTIDLQNPVEDIEYPRKPDYQSIATIARELGAKTINDLIRLSYDKLKEHAITKNKNSNKSLPVYKDDTSGRRLHLQAVSYWNNIVTSLLYKLDSQNTVLSEIVKKWINYIKYEFENDTDVLDYENDRSKQEGEAKNEWDRKQKTLDKNTKLLGKLIWEAAKRDSWAGWEDSTEKDAYDTAKRYFTVEPYERGQFRKEIKDLARRVTTQKETPTKQYYMQPAEVEAYVRHIQNVELSALPVQELVDIIEKTVGITGNKYFGDPKWNEEEVVPGLSAGILGYLGNTKVLAMDELRKRIMEHKSNKKELKIIYDALDSDLKPIFFRV